MSVIVSCPNPACAASCSVADCFVGQPVRCPRCGKAFVPTGAAPSSPAATTIGRYQVRSTLGTGAFGTVYRAYDPQLDREVALKLLRPESLASPKAVERFQREARAAARMLHPNIVPVHDAGRHGPCFYIASALIAGRTLARLIPEGGMDPRRAAGLVAQLADALACAHQQNVLHRDVKPANVLVDDRDHLFLTDFGLAGWVEPEQTRMTRLGAVMGTPAYMAPEQAAGDVKSVGPQADVYAAGVVLYELLTGRVPFEGPLPAVIYQVTSTPPPPLSLRPGLDARLEAICLRAMAKKPRDRFADAAAFAAELRTWLAETSTLTAAATRGPGAIVSSTRVLAHRARPTIAQPAPLVSVAPRPARPPGRWIAVMLAVLSLVGLAGFLLWPRPAGEGKGYKQEESPASQKEMKGNGAASEGKGDKQEETVPAAAKRTEEVLLLRRAARHHDAEACFRLGRCYARGAGVPRAPLAARFWYEQARKGGHAEADKALAKLNASSSSDLPEAERLFRLDAENGKAEAQQKLAAAYLHRLQGVIERHEGEGLMWLREAVDQDYGPALAHLALLHHNAEIVPRDTVKARQLYRRAADKGELWCLRNLGKLYEAGDGTPVDLAEAARCYRRAADAGDGEAQFRYGNCLADGKGVQADAKAAVVWWEKAAAGGHPEAKTVLESVKANSGKIQPEAERLYLRKAEAGEAEAQHLLGWAYHCGHQGVAVNHATALKWFRKAAAQGHAASVAHLGWHYANGIEVPRDLAEAIRWYRRATDKGDSWGARNLAYHYLTGNGVKADPVEAVRCFRVAAKTGDSDSEYQIGNCYADGRGVPRDLAEAVRWWRKAAAHGHEEAKKALEATAK